MPTPTYDLIASSTPSSGASTVEFTNLGTVAAAYRDLVLVMNMNGQAFAQLQVRINGLTTSIYNWRRMTGTGSVAESDGANNINYFDVTSYSLDTGQKAIIRMDFLDFSQTNKHKVGLCRFDSAQRATDARAWRFATTSAITSISVYYNNNTYPAGCTLDLYGIVS